MKRFRQIAVLLLAVALVFSCGVQGALAENVQVQVKANFRYEDGRKMLDLINNFRTGKDAWYLAEDNKTRVEVKGLGKLSYDYNLEKTAMQRAVEIAVYFNHTRPDGSAWSAAFPGGCTTRGENICYGYGNANAAFTAFAEEDKDYAGQGHRRNMLRKEFTKVGIGCVKVGNTVYWAQAFGGGAAGGSDSARYSSGAVNASADLLVKSARKLYAEGDAMTLEVGESAPVPNAIVVSNSGAQVIIKDVKWTASGKAITLKSGKVKGAKKGKAKLETKIGGKAIEMPVTVVKGGSSGGGNSGSNEDVLTTIEDYDPPLYAEWLVLLEDDECFESDPVE